MCLLVVFPVSMPVTNDCFVYKCTILMSTHRIFLPVTIVCTFITCNVTPPPSRYIFETPSGVMCLDIHPEHPYLVAAGLYDGTVLVYDLQENSKEAIYKATANTGKHSDPVWQVCKSLRCVRMHVIITPKKVLALGFFSSCVTNTVMEQSYGLLYRGGVCLRGCTQNATF